MSRSIIMSTLCLLALARSAGAADMPGTPAEARALERADALPRTVFYDAAPNLASTHPGDLLRQQRFEGYALTAGTRTVRILYHSLDAAGQDVVSSAVVLVPGGAPPTGGWPVIAWAHGTSGVARQCAPSLMKDLYYGDETLNAMISGGFAVIAVDYHGLGTAGLHEYVTKLAQARDVIYAVPAARAAVAALGRQWVVDGHSQGGGAAWGVAELESSLDDPDYLGAVSVAGTFRLEKLIAYLNDTQGGAFYVAFMAAGIQAQYPEFEPQQVLTARAMRLFRPVTTQGCWFQGYALFKDMPKHGTLKPNWQQNPWVQRYIDGNRQATVRLSKPLLVIGGEGDETIPIEDLRAIVRSACATGSSVQLKTYPGLDHDPTMTESTPDQLSWIRDRLAGKPMDESACTTGPGT